MNDKTQRLVPARFTLDMCGLTVDGVHRPGERWNGWACPLFTPEVAALIAAHFANDEEPLVLRADGTYVQTVEGEDTEYPLTDGLYAIGAYAWCWDEEYVS